MIEVVKLGVFAEVERRRQNNIIPNNTAEVLISFQLSSVCGFRSIVPACSPSPGVGYNRGPCGNDHIVQTCLESPFVMKYRYSSIPSMVVVVVVVVQGSRAAVGKEVQTFPPCYSHRFVEGSRSACRFVWLCFWSGDGCTSKSSPCGEDLCPAVPLGDHGPALLGGYQRQQSRRRAQHAPRQGLHRPGTQMR